MKKQLQLGLVVEGNSSGSAVLRLPRLTEELGPIKSPALRMARRLSNFLRAGYAVAQYEELAAARLILLRVPDSSAPRIVDELCASGMVFRDLSFVLCESWLTSEVLHPLRRRGASVATLIAAPSARRDWFVMEGQISAVRQTRRLIERSDARVLEIHSDAKHLYFAAELLAGVLPMPLYLTAQKALRESGISGNRLHGLLDQMAQEMFNRLLKGGRKSWGGALNRCPAETARAYFKAVRESHPQIADVLAQQFTWATKTMEKQESVGKKKTATAGLYREAASM